MHGAAGSPSAGFPAACGGDAEDVGPPVPPPEPAAGLQPRECTASAEGRVCAGCERVSKRKREGERGRKGSSGCWGGGEGEGVSWAGMLLMSRNNAPLSPALLTRPSQGFCLAPGWGEITITHH